MDYNLEGWDVGLGHLLPSCLKARLHWRFFAAILATIFAAIPRRFESPVAYREIALEIAAKITNVNGP